MSFGTLGQRYSDDFILDACSEQIRQISDQAEAWNFSQDIHRFKETVKICPDAPAKVLDLGYSTIYSPVLAKIAQYEITPLLGLSINFEGDRYPFEDGEFDGIMCCEVIEHYTDDPMFSMIEINRITRDGGFLVLSTPNVVAWEAIYRALRQDKHPSRWPLYAGGLGAHCIHAREYMVPEVVSLVEGAGFKIEEIYTANYDPLKEYPEIPGFPTENRGETIFCRARKVSKPLKRAVLGIYGHDVPYTD